MMYEALTNTWVSNLMIVIGICVAVIGGFLLLTWGPHEPEDEENPVKNKTKIMTLGTLLFVAGMSSLIIGFNERDHTMQENEGNVLSNLQQKYDIDDSSLNNADTSGWEDVRDVKVTVGNEEYTFEMKIDTNTWEPTLDDKAFVEQDLTVEDITK